MTFDNLPVTDLDQLRVEVLASDPSLALPRNLNDHWLATLARDLDAVFATDGGEPAPSSFIAPVKAVMHILSSRAGGSPVEMPFEQLQRHLLEYRIELHMELVRRNTEVKCEPATLETIFTDRTVNFTIEAS